MSPTPSPPRGLRTLGLLLFLFIPAVLYLFTVQPEPLGLSLAAGIALMLGHRFLARPYMERARPWKCLWCNRLLPGPADPTEDRAQRIGAPETVALLTGRKGRDALLEARCCAGHGPPTARFFTFLESWRAPLAIGIFAPLLLLLATLAAAAVGWDSAPVTSVTALFKLVIGLTVNVAAFGYLAVAPRQPARVPFPVHNFFLLGVGPLLWIFRGVGVWWIVRGGWTLLRTLLMGP